MSIEYRIRYSIDMQVGYYGSEQSSTNANVHGCAEVAQRHANLSK